MSRTRTRTRNASPPAPTTCELGPCDEPVAGGARICARCAATARTNVRKLTDSHRACCEALTTRPSWLAERVGGSRRLGLDLDERAVTVRSDIIDVVTSWCALVTEVRQVPPPSGADVASLAAHLDQHLSWLVSHPAAPDFAAEVAELLEAADAVIDPDHSRRVALGPCQEPGCGRPVYATVYASPGTTGDPVACTEGHQVPPHRWALLHRGRYVSDRKHHSRAGAAA